MFSGKCTIKNIELLKDTVSENLSRAQGMSKPKQDKAQWTDLVGELAHN